MMVCKCADRLSLLPDIFGSWDTNLFPFIWRKLTLSQAQRVLGSLSINNRDSCYWMLSGLQVHSSLLFKENQTTWNNLLMMVCKWADRFSLLLLPDTFGSWDTNLFPFILGKLASNQSQEILSHTPYSCQIPLVLGTLTCFLSS